MHARAVPWDAALFATNRLVPILNIKEGPGWVDVQSPGIVGIDWVFDGNEDLVSLRRVVRTGPAGWVSVWVGQLGTQVSARAVSTTEIYDGSNGYVDQFDGHIVTGVGTPPIAPQVRVRFHPAEAHGGGAIQSRSLNAQRIPAVIVSPGTSRPVGYPILGREMFVGRVLSPGGGVPGLIFHVMGGNVAAPVTLWSSPVVEEITLDMAPDTWVQVENTGAAVHTLSGHWRDLASVPQ